MPEGVGPKYFFRDDVFGWEAFVLEDSGTEFSFSSDVSGWETFVGFESWTSGTLVDVVRGTCHVTVSLELWLYKTIVRAAVRNAAMATNLVRRCFRRTISRE